MNNKEESNELISSRKSLARKSRSISRYFLGVKRSSIDGINDELVIRRSLQSAGILDSFHLWSFVTMFRDYSAYRRVFILTDKNQLIIGKFSSQRQSLMKVKEIVDVDDLWIKTPLDSTTAREISSLNYFDLTRSFVVGWPPVENFIVEFSTKSIKDSWSERFQSFLRRRWLKTSESIEHVRIVVDQDAENSFLIRKLIGIRPEDTARDLIQKSIDAFHFRDTVVNNYLLYVSHSNSNHSNNCSTSIQRLSRPLIGHEYPYAIKMKYLKASSGISINNRSFDTDEHSHYQFTQSSASLTSINATSSHDFELRKREIHSDQPMKKHRFFNKRRAKSIQQISEDSHSSSTPHLNSPARLKIFGHQLGPLMQRFDEQLPPIIMQLLQILYSKGPETTGIFRKVANARSVRESIEKIERDLPLNDVELHPILAAGILKHFLRTLPEPVFDSIQYDSWKKCLRLATLTEKISFAKTNILLNLSEQNHILLKGLICVLYRIAQNADLNGMNPFNLGLCVSNSLFKTESTTISSGKQEADVMSSIVEFLIENSIVLFGPDVLNCVCEKRILLQKSTNRIPVSSIESLDEVESSPRLPVVNRSHDSGLAVSDPPFHDDSSEMSEHTRHRTVPIVTPISSELVSSIACGRGLVLTSILVPKNNSVSTKLTAVARRRSSKTAYKPSKQFLQREKSTHDTTDDSDHLSSQVKRSKSLSRHSSMASNEQQKLTKRSTGNVDVKRTTSLKQSRPSSAKDTDKATNSTRSKIVSTPKFSKETQTQQSPIRSSHSEQVDLDLINETIPSIHQTSRCFSSSTVRNKTVHIDSSPKATVPRNNAPLSSTTNQIVGKQETSSDFAQVKSNERVRTFIHQSNSRPFVLGKAIQMKPINAATPFQERNRQGIVDSSAVRLNNEHRSGLVRERAKLFEHISTQKLSTGRENYV